MSAIVPMVPGHLKYLPRLLKNLSRSTLPFDEIVIVASGFSMAETIELERKLARIQNPVVRLVKTELAPAGTNRNIGWREAAARYLAFLDADDLYRKDRLEILLSVLKSENATAVVHDYVRFRSSIFGRLALVGISALEVFLKRDRNVSTILEISERNANNTNVSSTKRIHHAHVLVDRESLGEAIRFSDTPDRNEDALLLRSIQEAGGDIHFCNARLSAYFLGSRVRKLLVKLRQ